MSRTTSSTFLSAAAVVGLVGCLAATVTAVVAADSAAFTGSVATSGIVGIVFAARNVQLLRDRGTVSLPPAVLTTIFGGWFMLAPLLYDAGFLATAGTQLSGMLVSSFALYTVVAGLDGAGE